MRYAEPGHEQSGGLFVSGLGLELGSAQQMAHDHALDHLQDRGDQLGLRGQQHAQLSVVFH